MLHDLSPQAFRAVPLLPFFPVSPTKRVISASFGLVLLASFMISNSHSVLTRNFIVGVPFCPLPEPHADPERQKILLEHLNTLFSNPVLLGNAHTTAAAQKLVPGLEVVDVDNIAKITPVGSDQVFPARKPSSDEPVAFMLTSGSTGNSKAVVLRHSNFLSSCNGKSVHHGTSADSVFFNWIAIDHVASLSEIHIHALLAGARYVLYLKQYALFLTLLME
jgi:acyl-CoA synthetase (AMP-forming)/AMP-acid ligase II